MCRKREKHQYGYLLSFIFPSVLLLGMYVFQRIFPFGNNTIAIGDMTNQYLAIMTYFKHNIVHPSNFLYSYQISIGGNFFSVLTYYLVCPFNFLAFLFPEGYIPLFYMINTIVDVGLIGLTTYTYLKNSFFLNRNMNENQLSFLEGWRVFLAGVFPFSAFFANYMHCVMWINAIVLVPLVLLGLDRILYRKESLTWLYWTSLMFTLITNYYIGVIILVFLFLTMFFWIIDQICQRSWLKIVRKGITVLLLTVASILGAGIVMWPSYLAQKNVVQAQMPQNNILQPMYKLSDFIRSLFTGIVNLQSNDTAPLIFTGVLVIVLFNVYFFVGKILIRERILTGLFTLVLIASSHYLYFYMIWHSLSMPNGYHQRESFVISFFMICIAYRGLMVFQNQYPLKVFIPVIFEIMVLLFGANVIYKHLFTNSQLVQIIIILVLIGISAILISKAPRFSFLLIMLIGLINIIVYNSEIQTEAFRQVKNSDYTKVVDENQRVINALKKYDSSFYRVGTTAQINECDPLLYGYNGVQAYLSQQPTSETDYLSALGFYQKLGWIRWSDFNNGSTAMINDMLGIKYIIKSDNLILKLTQNINSMPTYNNQTNIPDISPVLKDKYTTVYQNPYAFPLVFGSYNGIGSNSVFNGEYNYVPEGNPFVSYNWMFRRLSGKQWLYDIQNGFKLTICKIKNMAIAQGFIRNDGDVYCYITKQRGIMPGANKYLKVIVNGKNIARYSNQNQYGENGIIYLGHFKKGDHLDIEIKNANNDPMLSSDEIYVAVENQKMLHQIYNESTKGIGEINVNGPKISMETTSAFKQHVLIASVPYDKAWRVTVDGHTVKPKKALGGLLGISMTSGEHKVCFKYIVPGLRLGGIISLITIIILISYEFIKYKTKNNHYKKS